MPNLALAYINDNPEFRPRIALKNGAKVTSRAENVKDDFLLLRPG